MTKEQKLQMIELLLQEINSKRVVFCLGTNDEGKFIGVASDGKKFWYNISSINDNLGEDLDKEVNDKIIDIINFNP